MAFEMSLRLAQTIRLHLMFSCVVLFAFLSELDTIGPMLALRQCAIAGVSSLLLAEILAKLMPIASYLLVGGGGVILWILFTLAFHFAGFLVGFLAFIVNFKCGSFMIAGAAYVLSACDLGAWGANARGSKVS